MNSLRAAIAAAGKELQETYSWSLDIDDDKAVLETLFAKIILKHLAPVVDPQAAALARIAKIASLQAELAALIDPIS